MTLPCVLAMGGSIGPLWKKKSKSGFNRGDPVGGGGGGVGREGREGGGACFHTHTHTQSTEESRRRVFRVPTRILKRKYRSVTAVALTPNQNSDGGTLALASTHWLSWKNNSVIADGSSWNLTGMQEPNAGMASISATTCGLDCTLCTGYEENSKRQQSWEVLFRKTFSPTIWGSSVIDIAGMDDLKFQAVFFREFKKLICWIWWGGRESKSSCFKWLQFVHVYEEDLWWGENTTDLEAFQSVFDAFRNWNYRSEPPLLDGYDKQEERDLGFH